MSRRGHPDPASQSSSISRSESSFKSRSGSFNLLGNWQVSETGKQVGIVGSFPDHNRFKVFPGCYYSRPLSAVQGVRLGASLCKLRLWKPLLPGEGVLSNRSRVLATVRNYGSL